MSDNWQCPYCNHHMVVTDQNLSRTLVELNDRSKRGQRAALQVVSISCSNKDCKELTVDLHLGNYDVNGRGATYFRYDQHILQRRLIPETTLLTLPTDVPEEIQQTYREAKLIAGLSGRASAAMARRCLQGIVRDYWNIPENKRGNLGAELSYIRDKIDPVLWEDIQAVRAVGDIGAHMEKNVNEVIDVSPREAHILLGLIETLFTDWYIQRATRKRTSNALRGLLDEKRLKQKAAKQGHLAQKNEEEEEEPDQQSQ